ncbi:rho GTPase-activating protein 29 isoform X2 [Bombina bombina]|uniref:rho GTPase-activating protein 29 isoform X2 n=1 Tax=Bombina bombina TaxID=8345 RepID=UPI00235A974A|nr:rho GTPase-activating protein 29 isoform X2 [Bombina bombina]
MLRQNGGGNRRGLGFSRFSTSNFFTISNSSSWGMGRSTKSNSLSSISTNSDCYDNSVVDPDYIMQLVSDVRKFADVLLYLKEAFVSEENQDSLHQVVHERLGELLRVLKAVINKHQALNSVDILGAAGTVIAKVKAVNFKSINEENRRENFGEIFSSIDTLAFTFGNVVSDFLMGDVDNGSSLGIHVSRRSRSFENLSVEDSAGSIHERDDLQGHLRAEEVDNMLLRHDSGIESALSYAKAWSKYTKDILSWVEKRLSVESEAARNFAKMAETAKSIIVPQEFMPFQSIFTAAFQNDIENSQACLQTISALQSNKFMQPLQSRRSELDRQRKEIKDLWQREQKKMQELEAALRKAKLLSVQRHDEHEKAKSSTIRAEEEQLSISGGLMKDASKQLEKKRRVEEEALQKAEEAKENYKACVADVEEKRNDMENIKSEILTQVRELVYQCDLTLKAATVNLFQLQHAQVVSLPVNCQTLCEDAKLYEPGQQYSEFVKSLPKEEGSIEAGSLDAPNSRVRRSRLSQENSAHTSHGNLSQGSGEYPTPTSEDIGSPEYGRSQKIGQKRSSSSTDIQNTRGPPPFRSWSVGNQSSGMCSDSESAGGSSESRSMDSPSASPGDFKRRLPRTPSTGTMSSADDLDEREPPSPSDNGLNDLVSEMANSPGPFRNTIMSKAAQTHKLRKLRAPSKCRECDSLVVFHGAECEECSLACHKKCLETLAIQCGHKKLQGRLHLFGVEFTQAARSTPDGVPFIIKKCTSEIESRALTIKGIYRVNGAKSRVEKLCQAFENGKDLVELSDLYAHDISNVLKLYLRQLPEPLILFRLYNELIGLAKESQRVNDEVEAKPSSPTLKHQQSGVELNRVIIKIRDLLRQLPLPNYNTLQFLVGHLHRVTEEVQENKMSASNLGIIFGPTLIRPRQTDATISLSSLVDYPYQARIVELLITYYDKIFDVSRNLINSEEIQPEKMDLPEDREAPQIRKCQSLPVGKDDLVVSKRASSLDETSLRFQGIERNESLNQNMVIIEEKNGQNTSPNEHFRCNSSPDDSTVFSLHSPTDQPDCSMDTITESDVTEDKTNPSESSKTNVSLKSYRQVQLRAPRVKPISRPFSLPVDRLLPPSVLNEKNSKNVGVTSADILGQSPIIEEVSENKPNVNSCHRLSCYESQGTRKTWDRQYKQYDITPRTAMIMTNVPQEIRALDGVPASSISTNLITVNMTLPKVPSLSHVKNNSTTEGSSMEPNPLAALRAPRTLQPPPGTFYRPPSYKIKQSEETNQNTVDSLSTSKVHSQINNNNVNLVTDSEMLSDIEGQNKNLQKSTSEELQQAEVKPTYQRLRPKRMQELEHREAHFV